MSRSPAQVTVDFTKTSLPIASGAWPCDMETSHKQLVFVSMLSMVAHSDIRDFFFANNGR